MSSLDFEFLFNLDLVSVLGESAKRMELWPIAAFFDRNKSQFQIVSPRLDVIIKILSDATVLSTRFFADFIMPNN
jgi:hypothetical protein